MRNSTWRLPSLAAAALIVGVLALSGCGSDGSATASDPETTSTPSPTQTPTETPTGTPTDTVTATDTPTGSPAASDTTTAAGTLITLSSPTEGATVSGSFEVTGTANSPEANVPWTLTDSSGKAVSKGAFTADGWLDKLYPYTGTVDLSGVTPGAYTFVVAVEDDSDGESSSPQQVSVHLTVS